MYISELSRAIAISQSSCDRTPVLVDPELLKFLNQGVLCKVAIASDELELDAFEVPVPKDWKILELLVLNDSKETIKQIVASMPEYQGYNLVDHWQCIVENPF